MPDDWQRALVVAAHPDDIEYGIAAAVAAWTAAGKEVHYLLATRGEAGMAGRPAGGGRAAARGGGAAVGRRRRRDRGRVPRPPGRRRSSPGPELRRDLAAAIRRHRPELVVTGYFGATWTPPGVSPALRELRRPPGARPVRARRRRRRGQRVDLPRPRPSRGGRASQYIAVQEMPDPPHEVDVSEQVEKAVASLTEHRRYLELLSDVPVEEQARQIVDMSTLDRGRPAPGRASGSTGAERALGLRPVRGQQCTGQSARRTSRLGGRVGGGDPVAEERPGSTGQGGR